MHIPATMLSGPVCPVTLALGVVGVGFTALSLRKATEKPSCVQFAAITSMIFAMQMLNFPIASGTSGHLLGGALAVSFLGIPFAILSISLVLAVQAVFFGDGGINALGANIINMAFLGSAGAGIFLAWLKKRNIPKMFAIFCASWASVIIAAAACSLEVASAGVVGFSKALVAMVSVHAVIGLAEGLLTVFLVYFVERLAGAWKKDDRMLAVACFSIAFLGVLASPFASSFPDGLESVAGRLFFLEFHGFDFPVLFPDYQALVIGQGAWATICAGFIGVGIISGIVFLGNKFFRTA